MNIPYLLNVYKVVYKDYFLLMLPFLFYVILSLLIIIHVFPLDQSSWCKWVWPMIRARISALSRAENFRLTTGSSIV